MKKWLLILWFVPALLQGQWKLSDQAEIHIVTCGPYQGELYSAFGHSAIRVKDPTRGFDLIYNYGVFDFDQPNFYLNFARGQLNYRLAVTDYRAFADFYISENRFIHEQVLNLSADEKQAVFNFLQWNARPENMYYRYDYFYDNCATRVRDAIERALTDSLYYNYDYAPLGYSIRDLCDIYLIQQPWGDLGIDLCLGLPMDKKVSTYHYMFLPDYVEQAFAEASLGGEGQQRPLVRETIITYEPTPGEAEAGFFPPWLLLTLVMLLGVFLSYHGYRKGRAYLWLDLILQTTVGLLGWLLLALWLLTDHQAAAGNLNLLWAMPLYFPLALILLRKRKPAWLGRFYRVMALVHLLTLLGWFFLPQDLHPALIPLVILLLLRSALLSQRLLISEVFGSISSGRSRRNG